MEKINDLESLYLLCAKHFTENKIKKVSYVELVEFLNGVNSLKYDTVDRNEHEPPISPDIKHLLHRITGYEIKYYYENDPNNVSVKESLFHPFPVKQETFDYYYQHLKNIHNEKIARRSYWIAIIALGITGIQLIVDYWDIHHGKDFKHETNLMHLDSIQVQQNKEIIELLKKAKQRDTVVINLLPSK